MAPTYANADLAYRNAAARLRSSCRFLDGYLTPVEPDETIDMPPDKPIRAVEVPSCDECTAEIELLEAGDRAGHVCTHGGREQRDVRPSVQQRVITGKRPQPNAGVIREYMGDVNTKLESFTTALSTLCSLMDDREEVVAFEDHLMVWVDYCGWLKNRAYVILDMLETATTGRNTVNNHVTRVSVQQVGVSDNVMQLIMSLLQISLHIKLLLVG